MVQFYREPPTTPPEIYESQQTSIRVFCAVFIVVPTLAVMGRFWARVIRAENRLWWDDWLLLLLWALVVAFLGIYAGETADGLGKHVTVVNPDQFTPLLKSYFIGGILYWLISLVYKNAAIFLYLRVFGTNAKFTITSCVLIVIVTVYSIAMVFMWAFYQCDPPSKIYDIATPGHCRKIETWTVVSQAISAALDIAILILPLPMIKALDLTRTQKIWLTAVFCWGYIVTVIPLVRVGLFSKYAWTLDSTQDLDFTWNTAILDYVICIEGPVAILGLSSPPIFQLIQRVRHHGFSALFKTYPYLTKSGVSTDPGHSISRASTDGNKRLVNKDPYALPNVTEDFPLGNILQSRNISITEEQYSAQHPPFSANATLALPPGKV